MNTYEDFRNLVRSERENLTRLSDLWDLKVNGDKGFSKEIQGRIRATVGKTRLLLAEKFKQFEGLIDQSENNTSEKEISMNDLQGFWDLVLIQVNEIKEIFRELDETRLGKYKSRESDVREGKWDSSSRKFSPQSENVERKCRESSEREKTRSDLKDIKNNVLHSKI